MTDFSTPIQFGELKLKNRVVMAPLTRSRATADRVPTAMMAEYYAQRASAGLIISEATVISEEANGYEKTPGLFTDEQVEGWKLVTNAVHGKGGLIVAQLWHVGRVSHPDLLNGETPVSASNVKQAGYVSLLRPLIEVWGAGRVGVHLAPRGDEHDMGDANPKETFGYVMQELGKRQIAFFFTREYLADDSISLEMKARSNGVPYIANMRLSREDALELLASGKAEAVSFGKAYIANPDLFERLVEDEPLNELKLENMIGTDVAEGYIDYPFLNKQLAES